MMTSMKTVHIPATWSRLAPAHEVHGPLRLHQHLTLHAFARGADAVVNTARTGDGKTLAALLSGADHGGNMLLFYPTRELMQDQAEALASMQAARGLMPGWTWQVLNSDTLDAIQATAHSTGHTISRARALRSQILRGSTHLISSPDLIDLVLSKRYAPGSDDVRGMDDLLRTRVSTVVIDEFHLYDAMQIHKLLLILAQLRAFRHDLRVLLLSATADEQVVNDLGALGLKNVEIIRGEYRDQDEDPGEGWQEILRSITLQVPEQKLEAQEWLALAGNGIKSHLTHSDARALVILGSLREAALARPRLQAALQMPVERITGLTPAEERRLARLHGRVVVATSTVDVGVDFKISALAFQAWDQASFIQRLGRLGRGARQIGEPTCHAWTDVVLPDLQHGQTLLRPQLFDLAAGAFRVPRETRSYRQHWGRTLSALRLAELRQDRSIKAGPLQAYRDMLVRLGGFNSARFENGWQGTLPRFYKDMHGQAVPMTGKAVFRGLGTLREALQAFRSAGGEAEVALLDLEGHWHHLSLVRVLRLAEVKFLDRSVPTTLTRAHESERVQIIRIRDAPLQLDLQFFGSWDAPPHLPVFPEPPRVLSHLTVMADDANFRTWQPRINAVMNASRLIALPLPGFRDLNEARARLGLPPLADLRLISDSSHPPDKRICACGSLAFLVDHPQLHPTPVLKDFSL